MNDSIQLYENELSLVTKPIPKLSNPDDVLIRVAYSGVCGTDLHIIAGEFPSSTKALTLGHEFCGIIENIGTSVTTFKPGDRVVVNPNNSCNVCRYCRLGQPHFCVKGRTETVIGIFKNGGWANYCRISSSLVYKLSVNFPLRNGIFVEPISCILRGWHQLNGVKQSKNILICGAGIIGLLWANFLHHKGYRNVTISEISESRRGIAVGMKLGYQVVSPDTLKQQYESSLDNSTFNWGFDVVIDCSGSPQAIQQAFEWLRFGATFLCFGMSPKESEISINALDIMSKELKLVGSVINPFTFEPSINVVENMAKYLDYDKLGVKVFTLQDYPAALRSLKERVASKSVFKLDFNVN